MRLLAVVLTLVAGPAIAQDWRSHSGDEAFDAETLQARLSGQTLTFYDEGQSVYDSNGEYQYIYGGGGTWFGHWEVADNSRVCVTFVTGVERCDRFVTNGDRLVLQTADGMRFPIRP
ncbi:MAG: hypothetical protein ACU0BK_07730 [Shimia sp.]|uniref:hypothetical protein n=1 Tax=Shimia sp. TaxID=1954381 RepID=UPI004058CC1A